MRKFIVWISWNVYSGNIDDQVIVSLRRPTLLFDREDDVRYSVPRAWSIYLCISEFRRMFRGIKLRPGESRRFEISWRMLEPKRRALKTKRASRKVKR